MLLLKKGKNKEIRLGEITSMKSHWWGVPVFLESSLPAALHARCNVSLLQPQTRFAAKPRKREVGVGVSRHHYIETT